MSFNTTAYGDSREGSFTRGHPASDSSIQENVSFLSHQNILKRTTPGSQDEDMATKAFSALKEVSPGVSAVGF